MGVKRRQGELAAAINRGNKRTSLWPWCWIPATLAYVQTLRFPGESDEAFQARADRIGRIARILVDASLANRCVQDFMADPAFPYTIESVRRSPTVRVEFGQAIAIGDLGSCLSATKSKHWGDGPCVLPLEPDDPVDPFRILYVYRENSVYNRRFRQRQRLKELLGKRYRPLVERAKSRTKTLFLEHLTRDEADAIRRILDLDPATFWQTARGRRFVALPPRLVQLELDFRD